MAKTGLSNSEEIELINLVRTRPCLYNLKQADYKDVIKKANTWGFIGGQLNKTGEIFNGLII
jgi:hypothetical protein